MGLLRGMRMAQSDPESTCGDSRGVGNAKRGQWRQAAREGVVAQAGAWVPGASQTVLPFVPVPKQDEQT